jgi:hypothetical protein
MDHAGVMEYFANNFDFTPRETVAIMGGHTLGRAVPDNSGFDGRRGWVPDRNELDNAFYRVLLDDGNIDQDFVQELQNNPAGSPFPDQFM